MKKLVKTVAYWLQSKALLYLVLGIIALKILSLAVILPFTGNFFFADVTKTALMTRLNNDRKAQGLNTLTENQKLDEAAYLKAQDMIANNYFAHFSPTGVTPWFWFGQAHYVYHYAGENLAVGFSDSQNVFDAWVASPTHNANLLNPNYTEVGTAVVPGFGSDNAILVVQLFGSQFENKAVAPIKPTPKPVEPQSNITQPQKVLAAQTENIPYNSPIDVLQYASYALLATIGLGLLICLVLDKQLRNRHMVGHALVLIVLLLISTVITAGILPHQILIKI